MNGLDLARSPDLYPQKIDLVREAALVVPFSQQAYRAASFLDDRILSASMRASWLTFTQLQQAAQGTGSGLPLHFIFHAGHVGSTLLSRLLDEAGALGLREPLPLRTLAEVNDALDAPESLLSRAQFDHILEITLRLWSRGYADNRAVIVKATSTTGRLAPALLAARPQAKTVYLNLAIEPYLATLLAGPNAIFDLRGFASERMRRLHKLAGKTGIVLHTLSLGKLAAMTWLTERLTQASAERSGGERVLSVDFDHFLADRTAGLGQILSHFGLPADAQTVARLADSPTLNRYSRAPDQYAYGDAVRAQAMGQARREHAAEIGGALAWLERLGAQNAVIGAVL
jgi:hypothetical protein